MKAQINAYSQHPSDIVQRLVLVKAFYKLFLTGLLFVQISFYFSGLFFPTRESNASKILLDD